MSDSPLQSILSQLDPHVLLHFLLFARPKQIFDELSITRSILQVLKKTKLFHDLIAEYEAYPQLQEEYLLEKESIEAQLKESEDKLAGIEERLTAIAGAAPVQENLNFLLSSAKLYYETGQYALCKALFDQILSKDKPYVLTSSQQASCRWGMLNLNFISFLTTNDSSQASTLSDNLASDFSSLYAAVEILKPSNMHVIHRNAILINCMLLAFLAPSTSTNSTPSDILLDYAFDRMSLTIIENSNPFLLRHVTAAAILTKRKKTPYPRQAAHEIKIVLDQNSSFNDNLCLALEALVCRFDAELAMGHFSRAVIELRSDLFLSHLIPQLKNRFYLLVLELKSRVCRSISSDDVMRIFDVSKEDGVELIKDFVVEGAGADGNYEFKAPSENWWNLSRSRMEDAEKRGKNLNGGIQRLARDENN